MPNAGDCPSTTCGNSWERIYNQILQKHETPFRTLPLLHPADGLARLVYLSAIHPPMEASFSPIDLLGTFRTLAHRYARHLRKLQAPFRFDEIPEHLPHHLPVRQCAQGSVYLVGLPIQESNPKDRSFFICQLPRFYSLPLHHGLSPFRSHQG